MAVHMVDHVKGLLAEALENRPNTEDIGWDAHIQGTENGPVVVVLMVRPGAVLGTKVTAVAAVKDPLSVSERDVAGAVHDLIAALDEQRSQQLSVSQPASNGEPEDGEGDLGPLHVDTPTDGNG